ncbi:Hypothetical predicted protein [Podarcis lilfordi]|uniref:Uncharacterized protein n=1 Tax=Podarcis lilfordi TaxID=74358 RepID=A0AA35NZS4_9SAUR|nr:Hypothetical predicted protein [Podarcis lilfordi]
MKRSLVLAHYSEKERREHEEGLRWRNCCWNVSLTNERKEREKAASLKMKGAF